ETLRPVIAPSCRGDRPHPAAGPPRVRPHRRRAGLAALLRGRRHVRARRSRRFRPRPCRLGAGGRHRPGCAPAVPAAPPPPRHLPGDATYVGVDVSPRMVGLATDRLRRWSDRATVALVEGGRGLPATDGSADRFVANYVFDLLSPEGTVASLAEARRVLAPGG